MAYTVYNQQLSAIEPYYTDNVAQDYDASIMRKCISELIEPVWTPLPNQAVLIEDDKNNPINNDKLIDEICNTLGDTINKDAEENVKSVWKQTLAYYKNDMTASEVFIAQANGRCFDKGIRLPLPSGTVIYTEKDIKDAAKEFVIQNGVKDISNFAVNIAFTLNTPCVIVPFLSKYTFDEFKAFVKNNAATFNNMMSVDAISKFTDFETFDVKVIEGAMLRADDTQELEAYSFSRLLMQFILQFAKQRNDFFVVAPYLDELLVPRTIVFTDIDQISKTPNTKLKNILDSTKSALKSAVKPISTSKIAKLSSAAANKHRIQRMLQNHNNMMNGGNGTKRQVFRFRKVNMDGRELSKILQKIIEKEVNVSASENYSKIIKGSFQRPSRRDPDNYNLQGKSISMQYKPDIHIYLDTSGSISEDNYKDAILTLITMAKKLNVNLYFNSFSHEISTCTKLNLRNRTTQAIYNEFQKVPKVIGGTNFSLVWRYIMESPKRRKEISLMITDFEYTPPRQRIPYPKKMYYAPIATSSYYWDAMKESAAEFCENMYHNDKNIRKHVLMK